MQTHDLVSIKTQRRSPGGISKPEKQEFEAIEFSNPTPPLQKGTRVGPYEIERLLGSGGMCKVYLARQISLNRMVAIKIIEGIANDEEMLEIFNKEIRTTAKISHRNVVTAIEGGISGENFYLSMNYIDGATIEEIVERHGPFTEKKAVEIMLTMGETLRYLHEKMKILHKDIKPGNIMIDGQNEIYLLDLGISQYAGEITRGAILGSPHYMSPEQIMGESLDWKTDLYSLGVTFYFIIFGTPPYIDEDINIIVNKHLKGVLQIPKEAKLKRNASENCIKIIRKMMAKNKNDRHQNWSSFLSELKVLQNSDDRKIPRTTQTRSSQARSSQTPSPPTKDKGLPRTQQAVPLRPLPQHSRLPLHKGLQGSPLNSKPLKPLIPLEKHNPAVKSNTPPAVLPPLIPLKKALDGKKYGLQVPPKNASGQATPPPIKKIKPLPVVGKDIRH